MYVFIVHLVWPNTAIPGLELISKVGAPGGLITPEYYLSLLTMHGTLMVFFVLTNAPFAAFGNYFLPIQIGAEDMAFPVLNMMSFWTTFVSLCVMVAAFFVPGGAPLAGWTAYQPLSGVGRLSGPGEGVGQTLWIISIAIFCGLGAVAAIVLGLFFGGGRALIRVLQGKPAASEPEFLHIDLRGRPHEIRRGPEA